MKNNGLYKTTDYDIFELHPCNRDLGDRPELEASMKKRGFTISNAIHVKPNGNGKFKVIRGHHRLDMAKRLGLPVYYIVDNSDYDIFDLEGQFGNLWTVSDFAKARAKSGDNNCLRLLSFKKKHGLTMGAAASLLGGQSAGSGNKLKDIKKGTFTISEDQTHSRQVVQLVDISREGNLPFASSSSYVKALSMALRIPEFDCESFSKKIAHNPAFMRKRGGVMEYLEEIEALYNYCSRSTIPIRHRAIEVSRERQRTFGKHN